jgi:hypothetical protein
MPAKLKEFPRVGEYHRAENMGCLDFRRIPQPGRIVVFSKEVIPGLLSGSELA